MGIVPCTQRGEAPQTMDVVGPVCESGDWLGRDRHWLQPGDATWLRCRRRPTVMRGMASTTITAAVAPPRMVSASQALQRGWKEQPVGGFSGFGTSPCTGARGPLMRMSGMASSSMRVYGWRGVAEQLGLGRQLHQRPRYITPTSSATWRTTARLCEMNR